MKRRRRPLGTWVIAIALVAAGCSAGTDRTATGTDEVSVAETPDRPSEADPTTQDESSPDVAEETADTDAPPVSGTPVPEASDVEGLSTEDILAAMLAADPASLSPDVAAASGRNPNGVSPERVVIPAIGVDADVIDLGLQADGTMEVPSDFAQTGWFKHGPRPGRVGPALIAGHVDDRNGPAVFFRLAELEPGDLIEVHGEDGDKVVFEVRELEQHPKDAFPTERVYAGTPGSELRLVTCGGAFDQGVRSYRDNIIVYAERVEA